MSTNHIIEHPSALSLSGEASRAMAGTSRLEIPPGYQRAIRFGANWTLITSPYRILFLVVVLAIGGAAIDWEDIGQVLEIAGTSPVAFGAPLVFAGLFHVLFFVTVVTLFAALRVRWPVRASLLLVCGAWETIMVCTMLLHWFFTLTSLGTAYVAGDAALRATLIPAATAADGLRQAFHQMNSFGLAIIWIMISLLPFESGLPRAVRWLGGILALALFAPDPSFALVIVLNPIWMFLLGRWLKRLPTADESRG
jgi:hypothetical protein